VPKEDIFMIVWRLIRIYKYAGSVENCMRTKYRARKFSDKALREHVLKNP
jgi:hypothetical protein